MLYDPEITLINGNKIQLISFAFEYQVYYILDQLCPVERCELCICNINFPSSHR